MPSIRNYSSKQPASKSAAQLQDLLAQNGAAQVSLFYGAAGEVEAVQFYMPIGERVHSFRLTVNVDGMREVLRKAGHLPRTWNEQRKREQAARTAWKNKLDWMGAQLAEIAAGQAQMEQLLLGYVVAADGRTAFEWIEEDGRLLGPPEAESVHLLS